MAETVDCVVIGGGVAGLTAAALLARKGRGVLLIEGQSRLGGLAGGPDGEVSFASAAPLLGGCGPRGWLRDALVETGALERLELIPLDPVYHAQFPRHQYPAAADPERFRQELSALWPAEAAGIQRFFTGMEALGRDYLSLLDGPPSGGPLLKHHDRTLAQFLDDCTRDEELRAALSALWLFAGVPPRRLSALHYASLWHTFHHQGAATVRGGVSALTEALAGVVREAGGTVETGVSVTRITRDRGRASGVLLSDGRQLEARAVLSTVSPAETFEELLSAEGEAPASYPPLKAGFITSISTLQVHLLVSDLPAPPARTTLLHATTDLDEAYMDLQRSYPDMQALVATVSDAAETPGLPEGKRLLSLYTLSPYSRADDWNAPLDTRRGPAYRTLEEYLELRDELAEILIEQAETLFPGLSERVEAQQVLTPLSLERLTGNTGGASFGWANIPEQSGSRRQGPRTPLRGLYMASHWTFPGGSLAAAATAGRVAAHLILTER